MDNNTCRVIFEDKTTVIYCAARPAEVKLGWDLKNLNQMVVGETRYSASVRAEYIPAKELGVLTLFYPDDTYDDEALAAKGFEREAVFSHIKTEAQLIRKAIEHFDNFVDALNRMSPHDQTEVGDILPAALREQAA